MARYQLSRQSEDGPHFNKGRASKILSIVGLIFCVLFGLASPATGLYILRSGGVLVTNTGLEGHDFVIPGGMAVSFDKYAQELFPLGLNVLVTICNDVTGYVHTVSLRWALQRESQLTFNSNLRLFTSAKRSVANGWFANFMMAVFMIMSYASTSLIFIREVADANVLPTGTDTFICSYAAITLAIAILGQAAVAFICLPGLFKAPTWSSDPLENTAACVSLGSITRRPGRCMRSVHQSGESARPACPSRRQRSAFAAHEEVRKVFWWLWAPIILAVIWGGILLAIVGASDGDGTNPGHLWSLFPVVDPNSESLSQSQITPSASIYWSQGAQMFDFGGF